MEPILTKYVKQAGAASLDFYTKTGGYEALRKALGIKPGETDANKEFTLLEVECLGACDRAPVVGVNDDWHECQRPEDAQKLIDGLRAKGAASLTGCHLKVAGE